MMIGVVVVKARVLEPNPKSVRERARISLPLWGRLVLSAA